MDIQVNWWAVMLATASSMVVGFAWYARPVFGNMWAKLINLNLDDKDAMGKNAGLAIGVTLVVSFLTAFVLAHVSWLSNSYYHNSFFQDAVTTAFWLWLGLTAARFITHDAFEQRPVKLTILNVAHEFVTIMVMGVVIGLLKP